MDEARLQSIQTGNKGRVGEYEDVQTSGSSLILIKRSFIVPEVFIKDLLYKIWLAWKEIKVHSFIAHRTF